MFKLKLTPGQLDLATLRKIQAQPVEISLCAEAADNIDKSAATVADVIKQGRVVYGVNTGFGLLANTRIPNDELETLQRSIVLSHAAGTGHLMEEATVRLLLVLKINSLARGYSGIRRVVIEALISLLNAQVYPCIPEKGSVGASGDLAPLAHMATVLPGE
ncbi:MAG: aromatic amino acid lyase, partial [Geopsychrobacter sp.]|nr:aromatic amino acid lyase [Geopsychrobacter sp.]